LLEVLAKGGEPMAEELTTPGEWVVNRGENAHITNMLYYGLICHLGELEDGSGPLFVCVDDGTVTGEGGDAELLADANLIAASKELLALARIIGSAYPNDPGTSDLDDSQPVTITLGVVRQAWAALAKVDR
jgi:hypothetical protein